MYTRVVKRKSAALQSRTLCSRTPQAFFLMHSKTRRVLGEKKYVQVPTKLAVLPLVASKLVGWGTTLLN